MSLLNKNLEKDMERAQELIRNCASRQILCKMAVCSNSTLDRMLKDKNHPVTAKTLYAILKYGPALQKSNKELV